MPEEQLTEQRSLEIITQMISKAKCEYEETGIGALLWGSLVTFCALITFGNFYWHVTAFYYIWLLTLFALIPQIIISVRAAKRKKFRSYGDEAMAAIWISFGVALFLVSVYSNKYESANVAALFMIMYGMPTFATGYIHHFKPMIIGGIVFWICAVICFYVQFPYIMLFTAGASIVAWVIPGLILRRRYLKAKKNNV
ncbi:MAG TPA: hypothetical protein VHB70_01125 [Parafilimonas sp.]|nr:hypothetical protein [Parafilimonas sp.]